MNKELRQFIRRRSGFVCERCGQRRAEHMHHLTYKNVPNELPEDIEHICLECHGEYHPQHTFRPIQEQLAIAAQRKKKQFHRQKKVPRPINPWKQMEREAEKALKKSARFNNLPMSRRRGP
jgi:hypothetical protein